MLEELDFERCGIQRHTGRKLIEYIKVNRKTEITIIFIRESLNDDIKTNSLSDPMSDRL